MNRIPIIANPENMKNTPLGPIYFGSNRIGQI
jgi:hypothetical protein